MKQYLFFYGTLKNKLGPPEISGALAKLKFAGDGFFNGRLYDLGEYPGAVLDNSAQSKVYGKLYELPDDPEVLSKLDRYEGFYSNKLSKSIFVRELVVVHQNGTEITESWTYLYNQDLGSSTIIPSGDFTRIGT